MGGDDAGPVDNAAALFGIALEPGWRAAAVTHFAALAKAAELVTSFPLDDDAEAAPVFTA